MDRLPELVKSDLPAGEHVQRVEELLTGIDQAQLGVLAIVTALGPYLTSEDDAVRARAIALLAEASEALVGPSNQLPGLGLRALAGKWPLGPQVYSGGRCRR